MTPQEFIARLASLVPHPREHQLTYQGVLAPASPLRDYVIPRPLRRVEEANAGGPAESVIPEYGADGADRAGSGVDSSVERSSCPRHIPWAKLLERVFAEDVLGEWQRRRSQAALRPRPHRPKFRCHRVKSGWTSAGLGE